MKKEAQKLIEQLEKAAEAVNAKADENELEKVKDKKLKKQIEKEKEEGVPE